MQIWLQNPGNNVTSDEAKTQLRRKYFLSFFERAQNSIRQKGHQEKKCNEKKETSIDEPGN